MAVSTAINTSGATIQFGTVSASVFTAGNIKIAGSATMDGQLEISSAAATAILASVLAVTSTSTVSITANNAIQAAGSVVIGGSGGIAPATSGSLSAGGGMLVKDEANGTNWFLHVHGDRLHLYNGSTELVFVATVDTIATASNALACSGNSNTATLASTVVVTSNATNADYQILFGSSNSLYSSNNVTMNPSTGTITTTNVVGRGGTISGFSRVYNAVWNDYADYITLEGPIPVIPGRVYVYDGHLHKMASSYAEMGVLGICSDTYSFIAGHKDNEHQIPIAVSGFVLAYVDRVYPSGTPLTSAPDGGLTEMSLETKMKYPERLLATFYKEEINKTWYGIEVNGRHWVKVC